MRLGNRGDLASRLAGASHVDTRRVASTLTLLPPGYLWVRPTAHLALPDPTAHLPRGDPAQDRRTGATL